MGSLPPDAEASLGMASVVAVIEWVNGLAFAVLGVGAVRSWLRHRDIHRAGLAVAVGALGMMAVVGRIAPVLHYPHYLNEISLVLFLLSGWGLVRFRHSVIPYSPTAIRLVNVGLVAAGVVALAARLPDRPGSPLTAPQLAVVMTVILAWSVCVGEPAVRFWREARGRMLVQRRRLRALSLAFGGIAVVLVAAIAVNPDAGSQTFRAAIGGVVMMLAPVMYAAITPPAWLRRRWRRNEHGAMRAAIERIVEADDERVLASEGLDWGLRLLGSERGFVSLDGRVLAARGMDLHDLGSLAGHLAEPGIHPVPSMEGTYAVVAALGAGPRRGVVVVMGGPFSPVFGRDELDTLTDLAVSTARAIERLDLAQKIRQESLRYETLLHAISDLGVGVSISKEGRIVHANDAISAITGYSKDELLAQPSWSHMIPPEERQHVADQLVGLFTHTPGSEHWSSTIVRADGERRELEGSAKLLELAGETHVLTISRDVTDQAHERRREQRRAEQLDALARSSQRLASARTIDLLMPAIAEAAQEVARCSSATVCVIDARGDAAWFGASGRAATPPGSVGVLEILVAERRPVRTSRTSGMLGAPGHVEELLAVPIVRAGHMIGAILMTEPETRAFDEIDEAVCISLAAYAAEVVESTRALARERSMIRRLTELDEIKNSFLAAVSHELRTPLTSVLGFAHTLQRSGSRLGDAERTQITDRLAVNAEKLERLLADLLDIDRLNRGIIEPVVRPTDLGALVLRAAETFDLPDARPVHVDVSPVDALIDGPKVERIIENLIANAVRHTKENTPIWVKVRPERDGVLILVEDAGPGVPEQLRTRIFEPFQQGPREPHSPGVGIGLSLVSRFAALHGGRAWVTDRVGGGASFQVWLPGLIRERVATRP